MAGLTLTVLCMCSSRYRRVAEAPPAADGDRAAAAAAAAAEDGSPAVPAASYRNMKPMLCSPSVAARIYTGSNTLSLGSSTGMSSLRSSRPADDEAASALAEPKEKADDAVLGAADGDAAVAPAERSYG